MDTPPITVFLWAWPPLSLLVASVGGHPLLAIGVTGVWTALQLTARGVL